MGGTSDWRAAGHGAGTGISGPPHFSLSASPPIHLSVVQAPPPPALFQKQPICPKVGAGCGGGGPPPPEGQASRQSAPIHRRLPITSVVEEMFPVDETPPTMSLPLTMALPRTSSACVGAAVPMPTLPPFGLRIMCAPGIWLAIVKLSSATFPKPVHAFRPAANESGNHCI